MKPDDNAFPLTRAQLDIWFSQQMHERDTGWHAGYFVVIEGAVIPKILERAIACAVTEAEPLRAAFYETNGRVLQKTLNYPEVDLPVYDLRHSVDPVAEAYNVAESILQKSMPLDGPLFKFALMQTGPNQSHVLSCCHHIVLDAFGAVLMANRVADIYSALIAGDPLPPCSFGSLRDLIDTETTYEASGEYADDLAYWTKRLSQLKVRVVGGSRSVQSGVNPDTSVTSTPS